MPVPPKLAEFERKGEDAYAAMYDARPYAVKDCYEEARSQFRLAIEAARLGGYAEEMARLERRLAHITAVYNSQFRDVGR
jgi:hypothetical protein